MKNKKVKFKPAKIMASVSLQLGKMSADGACAYIFHQPKVPKEIKLLKKDGI